ncbi:MAG: DNA polymerase III subunit alpha [Firmicutes bacterium]|nr:DNA polymerase III subunit alpha [Bacillota bacterium]
MDGGVIRLSVQLHTHSDYSLLRSALTLERLVAGAKKMEIEALALTDHNTTAGHVELARLCAQSGIKPIFGLEADIAYPWDWSKGPSADTASLVLLAENEEGYGNLLAAASEDFPLPLHRLADFAPGLILLEGGLSGQLTKLSAAGLKERAQSLNSWYAKNFPSSYYLRFDVEQSDDFRRFFPQSRFVLTQDVRYLQPSEKKVLQVLAGIGNFTGIIPKYPLLSWSQLKEKFSGPAEFLANTLEVAERCQVKLSREKTWPGPFLDSDFDDQVWEGARRRYPNLTPAVRRRILQEVEIIKARGFCDYFLIVAEIVRFAQSARIPVGPGRGSAASSIVAYCLGITSVDPLAWGLLFERFLNLEREHPPDIDLDFCYERRQEILEFVAERFGRDKVAQIGSYGTFGSRSAQREAGRILTAEDKPETPEKLAQQIQGLKRHRATHAAGVVITSRPTLSYTALYRDRKLPVTHLDMYSLEELGLLKIDLLGLRTLTLLARTEEKIQKRNPQFSLAQIPLKDEKTINLLSAGKSLGVFQLESSLYQELLISLRPRSFSDLVALLALGRPGPLNILPEFLRLREHPEQIKYLHPALEEILKETSGLILYQEQVMQIAAKIGQFSLGEADLLRLALGKNDQKAIARWRRRFIEGSQQSGLSPEEGKHLFQTLREFSGYAFNKAHSVSYALLTWQSAYLKAHYPQEFFLVLLNEGGMNKSQRDYLLDCQGMGLTLLPPDVLYSEKDFTPEGSGLRLGLGAIKQINRQTVQKIVEERTRSQFRDFSDFKTRTALPDGILNLLVSAGACDSLAERRFSLQSLGLQVPSARRLLEQERELVGIFASQHPAKPFRPLIKHIQGDFQSILGRLEHLQHLGRTFKGVLETEQGLAAFRGKAGPQSQLLKDGALVCLLGFWREGVFSCEKVFPLGPILLILPEKEQLEVLKDLLGSSYGFRPVILRLGFNIFHRLPREFWVSEAAQINAGLKEAQIVHQWFDPWKEMGGA